MTKPNTPTGQPPDEQPDTTHHTLLTLAEAANLLRTPQATLRYWRHLGSGPRSFKIGRHVVYNKDEVFQWLREQEAQDSD